MDKTWLEVEMDESVTLVRKKLEQLNNTEEDDVDEDILHQHDTCYDTLMKAVCLKEKKMKA